MARYCDVCATLKCGFRLREARLATRSFCALKVRSISDNLGQSCSPNFDQAGWLSRSAGDESRAENSSEPSVPASLGVDRKACRACRRGAYQRLAGPRFTDPGIPVPTVATSAGPTSAISRGERHETRHRHRGNHEARGYRDPLRLSGQSPDRACRQRRHPPRHGAAGAHRHPHGGRDLARHLGANHRRLLHAAWPRRRKRHGRRGAMLRRIRAGAGAADGLCAAAGQYRSELQFQPGDAGVLEIVRADQHRRRSLQHFSPRLHQTEERPRRTR